MDIGYMHPVSIDYNPNFTEEEEKIIEYLAKIETGKYPRGVMLERSEFIRNYINSMFQRGPTGHLNYRSAIPAIKRLEEILGEALDTFVTLYHEDAPIEDSFGRDWGNVERFMYAVIEADELIDRLVPASERTAA